MPFAGIFKYEAGALIVSNRIILINPLEGCIKLASCTPNYILHIHPKFAMINLSNFQVKGINVMCYRNTTHSMLQNIQCYIKYIIPTIVGNYKETSKLKGLLLSIQDLIVAKPT